MYRIPDLSTLTLNPNPYPYLQTLTLTPNPYLSEHAVAVQLHHDETFPRQLHAAYARMQAFDWLVVLLDI